MALFCGWELYMTTLYDENYIWQLFREFYMRTWNSRRPILCWLLLYLPLSFIRELYWRTSNSRRPLLCWLLLSLPLSLPALPSCDLQRPSRLWSSMIRHDTIHNDIIALPSCDLQGIWASMTLRIIPSHIFPTSWCCHFILMSWSRGDQIINLNNFPKGSASWWWST